MAQSGRNNFKDENGDTTSEDDFEHKNGDTTSGEDLPRSNLTTNGNGNGSDSDLGHYGIDNDESTYGSVPKDTYKPTDHLALQEIDGDIVSAEDPEEKSRSEKAKFILSLFLRITIGLATSAQPFMNSLGAWRRLKIEQIMKVFQNSTPLELVMTAVLSLSSLISNVAVALDNLPQLPGKLRTAIQNGLESVGKFIVNAINIVLGVGAGVSLGGLAVKAFTAFGFYAQAFFGAMSALVNFAVRYTGLYDFTQSVIAWTRRSFWQQKSIIDRLEHVSPEAEKTINQALNQIEVHHKCHDVKSASLEDQKTHYLNAYKTIIKKLEEMDSDLPLDGAPIFDESIKRKIRDVLALATGVVFDTTMLLSALGGFELLYSQSGVDFLRFATRFPVMPSNATTNATIMNIPFGNQTNYSFVADNDSEFQSFANDFEMVENYNNLIVLPANASNITNATNYFDQGTPYLGQAMIGCTAGFASAITGGMRSLYLRYVFSDTCYKADINASLNGVKNFLLLCLFWAIVLFSVANMFNVATNQVDQAKSDMQNQENDANFISALLWAPILALLDNVVILGASIGGLAINAKSLAGVVYKDQYKQNPQLKDITHYYKEPIAHPLPEKVAKMTTKLGVFSNSSATKTTDGGKEYTKLPANSV